MQRREEGILSRGNSHQVEGSWVLRKVASEAESVFSLVWQGLGHAGEGLLQGIRVRLKSGRRELGLYQDSGRP